MRRMGIILPFNLPDKPEKPNPNPLQPIKCMVAGLLSGAVNGLLGMGGGLVLVPLMTGWMKQDTKNAMATALAVMTPLSAVSFLFYLNRSLSLELSWPFFLGGAAGGGLAGLCMNKISAVWLRRIFGLFLLFGGARALGWV